MAELFLPAVIQAIVSSLTSPALNELRLVEGVDEEIQTLTDTMGRIRALLIDAGEKQVTSEALNLWLSQLKDVAYSAEDIIEEYTLDDSSSSEAMDQEKIKGRRFSSCICFPKVKFQHQIGSKIREIRERMDVIVKNGSRLQLRGVPPEETVANPQTYSYVTESEVYGRENDKSNIIKMLLASGSGRENLSIIPILGMMGVGKTTLAQLVYNDEEVTKHFHIKIWVSDDFDVNKLFKKIIGSIGRIYCDLTDMDQLQTLLRKLLDGKRYLLVLDDLRNEDDERWETFVKPLKCCGDNGSKIIVTTRSKKVATITGATNSYPLEADCWYLFAKRAFGGREDAYPNFIEIGKEIVKKCKGVPLAAKALGGLMSFKREASDLPFWISVRDNEIWKLPEDNPDGIFPALRLSYDHLPAHLKQCFAYCSVFPKDYQIEKETLIQQWIAADFVPVSMGGQIAEDIGDGYFNDLLWRSFFHDVEIDDMGEVKKCKMHDLVHDLAVSVAKDDCLTLGFGMKESTLKRVLYTSWLCDHDGCGFPKDVSEAKNLRAFLCICTGRCRNVLQGLDLYSLFSNARRIRVLSLGQTTISGGVPNSIGKLIHLRFLDLSSTALQLLPTSITSLQNLQTWKLPYFLSRLPIDMSNMVSLRHLDIRECAELTCMPSRIGQLTSLQTLPRFIVGKENGCGIEELENLLLRGDIRIDELENVGDVDNARKSKLKDKPLLRSVGFYWSEDESYDGEAGKLQNVKEVLEGLQPHENLKRLWVINYSGDSFPNWLMYPSLPNLVDIVLYNCKRCEILPPLGQLPHLRILTLDKMCSVKCLDGDFYGDGTVKGFPSLKTLVLRDMSNLVGWLEIDGIDLFPCLHKLTIEECNSLTCLPRLSAVRHLELCRSNAAILSSLETLTSLSFLGIDQFQELEFLPEGMLPNHTALRFLQISGCRKLRTLSMQLGNLTTLKSLLINNCSDLASLQGELQNLVSLEFLQINGCHRLTAFPGEEMQSLTSLLNLRILDCHNLTSLSQGLQYLKSLKKFTISSLPKLVSFPEGLQHVTTLESLWIEACHSFTSLPEWVGNHAPLRKLTITRSPQLECLQPGPQNFSRLQILLLWDWDPLFQRYREDRGPDWHSIEHIPVVRIKRGTISCGYKNFMDGRWIRIHARSRRFFDTSGFDCCDPLCWSLTGELHYGPDKWTDESSISP